MKLKLAIAILAIGILPVCAQAQQPSPPSKPTKASAQRVVAIVSGDKAKTKTYCEIADLGDDISQAIDKKDESKIEALFAKADELGDKIGPEYVALMDGLQDLDPDSKEGQEIGTILEGLDKLCQK